MTKETRALIYSLKAHITKKGVSLRDISSKCGIDHSNIGKTLNGKYNTSLDTFNKIADSVGFELTLKKK